MFRNCVFALIFALIAVPAFAEENAPPPGHGEEAAANDENNNAGEDAEDAVWEEWERVNETLVSVDFKDTPFDQAVAQLVEMSQANIVVTAEAVEKLTAGGNAMPAISMKLTNVPFLTAVRALAMSAGVLVRVDAPVVLIVATPAAVIGEIELRSNNATVRFKITEDDLPGYLRREAVERAVEQSEREARTNRQGDRRFNPDMMRNMDPEARERMQQMMERFGGRRGDRGDRGNRGDRGQRPNRDDAPDPNAPAPGEAPPVF